MQTVVNKVKFTIYGHGRGWCMIPGYFRHAGSDASVRQALSLLNREGMIRRLAKGIYDYPLHDEVLGILPPDVKKVAKVIADKNKIRIQPSGAYAANLMGFDDQVPARVVFVTDGVSKKIRVGNQEIIFRKSSPKFLAMAGTNMGLIIQALRHLGKKNMTPRTEKVLKRHLSKIDPKQIKKADVYAPAWIRDLIRKLKGGAA